MLGETTSDVRMSSGSTGRTMSAAKIGLGVAAGYLLGRTKKLKLAITVGSMLAGQRVAMSAIRRLATSDASGSALWISTGTRQ